MAERKVTRLSESGSSDDDGFASRTSTRRPSFPSFFNAGPQEAEPAHVRIQREPRLSDDDDCDTKPPSMKKSVVDSPIATSARKRKAPYSSQWTPFVAKSEPNSDCVTEPTPVKEARVNYPATSEREPYSTLWTPFVMKSELIASESEEEADDIMRWPSSKKFPESLVRTKTEPSTEDFVINGVAKKMMTKMGYQEGKGLGKHDQGRTAIIETSKQRGRRGLGKRLEGLEPDENLSWDFDKEKIIVEEDVSWLPECPRPPPRLTDMRKWMKEGPRKLEMDDETTFCDEDILKGVLSNKTVFDQLEGEEFRRARTRSNPYETIRGVCFLNRAAMKMANMDRVFDFMFTEPVDELGNRVVSSGQLLYFADVCAGPGGFSEYVLWRKKWRAKGFGFTLKGPNDFKLEDFFMGPCETFEPHYGVNGVEGDGDIFMAENQREFRNFVLQSTGGKGVHFVMADGGFSVDGQENSQEILSKQLYLCQCLVALYILRPGGHFVCKLFDLFTPFSVGLIYLMYHSFKNVCIHKPVTSRPANSERYLVCKWRRDNINDVHDYFFEVNCRLQKLRGVFQKEDVLEIVPLDHLIDDDRFFEYIKKSNEELGSRQIQNLEKIRIFYQNSELHEHRQSETRKLCLEYWKIPDQVRSAPSRPEPSTFFNNLVKNDRDQSFFTSRPTPFDRDSLNELKSIYDYYCSVSAVGMTEDGTWCRGFVLSLGRSHVFRWDGSTSKWAKLDLALEMSEGTLLYGEIVQELMGEGKGQRKVKSLHVIDAAFLGHEDVRKLHYSERIKRAQTFVHAISKPSRSDYVAVRVKNIYRLDKIGSIFESLDSHLVKGGGIHQRLCYTLNNSRFIIPQGILIFRVYREPWTCALSKSSKKLYFFNVKLPSSQTFDTPKDSIADFRTTFLSRYFWSWDKGAEFCLEDIVDSKSKQLCKTEVINYIHRKITNQ